MTAAKDAPKDPPVDPPVDPPKDPPKDPPQDTEGDAPCSECFPNGAPEGYSSFGCEHGQWTV